ncbi:shikimate kinase AroK [Enterobacteriaceae endosymbiont of Donacia versicolorea]|uniref:shikimate kinase AroK n=1 Tax=Enterobacteriaceae endosymbiont of Donacia versicolorea TaxID=2675788 RepID=UPI001449E4F7|nr:shikimate kinase AroK [Enterobacteriaceae endosymbiont of Donacia versicolorea]QJC32191.1 shikimate kinase AroK [Enterobacteriaceae endosymbiont of Donacia versicolorea]
MAEKRNIFLIGPMGAGKSTIGRHLANLLKMEFFDSDQEIELRTGADINWVFDVEGEKGFRKREKKIINEITQKKGIILATGGGSIKSKENRKFLSSRGIVVYLKTTIEKQLSRTKRDKKRPLLNIDKHQSAQEILNNLAKKRNHLYNEIADIIIKTDEQSARIVANKLIKLLEKN